MDVLLDIFNYMLMILLFSFVIYTVKYYSEIIRNKQARNDVLNLQAKVVSLRMALKVRVSSKVKNYKTRFLKDEEHANSIESSLNLMSDNPFETAMDFENYIEVSRKVNAMIRTEIQALPKYSQAEKEMQFEDFMGPDFKNEIAIVRILKEMTDSNEKLITRTNDYNQFMKRNKGKKFPEVPSLIFPSLSEVNRVFRDSEDVLKEQQESDPDLFEHVA